MKKNIVIIDDHPLVRQGLVQLLSREGDLHICGQADNVQDAISIVSANKVDLAIVDLCLKDSNGLDLIKYIHEHQPELAMLVFSLHHDSFYAERVLRAGGMGFVSKDEAYGTILTAIRRVLQGKVYLSEDVAVKLVGTIMAGKQKGSYSIDRLSDRELEVFEMLGQGMSNRSVAQKLALSIKTIETHRSKIKSKLQLKDSVELLQRAIQWTHTSRQA